MWDAVLTFVRCTAASLRSFVYESLGSRSALKHTQLCHRNQLHTNTESKSINNICSMCHLKKKKNIEKKRRDPIHNSCANLKAVAKCDIIFILVSFKWLIFAELICKKEADLQLRLTTALLFWDVTRNNLFVCCYSSWVAHFLNIFSKSILLKIKMNVKKTLNMCLKMSS